MIKTEYVQHQVETFENEMYDDFEEYLESVDQLKEEFHEAPEIFKKIQSMNTQNLTNRQFLGTLQHLLLLHYPPDVRKQYFSLIATIVEQMLFDGKGIDPDFRGRYKVNVDKIMAGFIDQNKFKAASDDLADSKAKAEGAYKENEKLDSQWIDNFGQAGSLPSPRERNTHFLFSLSLSLLQTRQRLPWRLRSTQFAPRSLVAVLTWPV